MGARRLLEGLQIFGSKPKEFRAVSKEPDSLVASLAQESTDFTSRVIVIYGKLAELVVSDAGFRLAANRTNSVLGRKLGRVFFHSQVEFILEKGSSVVSFSKLGFVPLLVLDGITCLTPALPVASAATRNHPVKRLVRKSLAATLAEFAWCYRLSEKINVAFCRIALHLNLLYSGAKGTAVEAARAHFAILRSDPTRRILLWA